MERTLIHLVAKTLRKALKAFENFISERIEKKFANSADFINKQPTLDECLKLAKQKCFLHEII